MQKTLLAMAVATTLASTSVNAATVYDQEGTSLDIYGRISMGISGGGPNVRADGTRISDSTEFKDVYSRLGFRMSQEINADLSAFGHLEWRFTGDEQNTQNGFNEVRQSYLGLKSKRFGTVLAGNFNSLYSQFVSMPFDVYQDRGLLFKSSSLQSWGDSIGYYTPELHGVTTFVQLKHYSERGLGVDEQTSEGTVVAGQAGVHYANGPFSLGFGAVENVVRGGGNGEMLYGLVGTYQLVDDFKARLGYEKQEDSDTLGGGYDTAGIGGTYTFGSWALTGDYYHIDRDDSEDSNAWAAGGYYKVTSMFDLYVELADGDAPSMQTSGSADDVYWLTGARYRF